MDEIDKWLKIKAALEAAGKTDSVIYQQALKHLRHHDVRVTKNDQF